MIKSFKHKGLQRFFETGSTSGIQAAHSARLSRMLNRLNQCEDSKGMNIPGWKLHQLNGRDLKHHFSVSVSGNWRMTFKFDGIHAVLVDYLDYH